MSDGTLYIKSINDTNINVTNGVAPLDVNKKIPLEFINQAILTGLKYRGAWNSLTNTPLLDNTARSGDFYYCNVASSGVTNLNGLTTFKVGDILIFSDTKWDLIPDQVGVTSVNGKTNVVTINKSDVGLSNADNTSDSQKSVLSATKLTTPRKINGVNFDGTTDITIASGSGVQANYQQEDFSKPDYILNRLLPATDTALLRQNGTPSLGTNYSVARTDHIHPSDSVKQDKPTGLGVNSCGDIDHNYDSVFTRRIYGAGNNPLYIGSVNGNALELSTAPSAMDVAGNINIGIDGAGERNIRIGMLNGNSTTSIMGGGNGVICSSTRATAKIKPREFSVSVEPTDNVPTTFIVKDNITANTLSGGIIFDARDGFEVKSATGVLTVPSKGGSTIPTNDTKFGIYRTENGLYTTYNYQPYRITKPQPIYLLAQSNVNVNPTENMVLKFPTIHLSKGGITYNANMDEFTLPNGVFKITSYVCIVDNGGGISNVIQRGGVDVGIWGNASDVSGSRGTSSPAIAFIEVTQGSAVVRVVVKEDATTSTDYRGTYIMIEQLDSIITST